MREAERGRWVGLKGSKQMPQIDKGLGEGGQSALFKLELRLISESDGGLRGYSCDKEVGSTLT